MATIDFNDQCWLRKSSPTGKALFGLGNGPGQNCMIGIGIGWYKPLGLQD